MPLTPTNRIQLMLDQMGIDWRAGDPMAAVLEDHQAFGRLIDPLLPIGGRAGVPPAEIVATAWTRPPLWRRAALWNLRRSGVMVRSHLGPPVEIALGGVVTHRWTDQAGRITLKTRMDDHRTYVGACAVSIVPGWKAALTAAEVTAIRDMTVIGRGRQRGMRTIITTPASPADAPYVRELAADPLVLDAVVGIDGATGILVACPAKLLMLPINRIVRLTHRHGPRAELHAVLDDGEAVLIAEHDEQHGLDLVARGLARAIETPLTRAETMAG